MCINNKVSFKSSMVNFVSNADNHGDILSMPQLMKAMQIHKKDLFEKSSEESTLNLLTFAGDFFMNPMKKGFLTHPELLNGDIQYNFLEKIIETAKNCAGVKNKFDTIYTPGNHCFDGGDEWLFSKIDRAPMKTVMSNIDLKNSPLVRNLMKKNPEICTEKIYTIPDSKDSEIKNKMLVLGVTIPSMDYFNPDLLKKTKFYNNSDKNDVLLEEKDLKKTISVIKEKVDKFKAHNPNGAVVVLSHTGNKISEMLAKNIPDINIIFNGHDHKEFETQIGKTLILSHGQNSKFFRGTQLKFDDYGRLSTIKSRKFDTEKYDPIARKDANLQSFVNDNIKEDLVPLVYFKNSSGAPEDLVLDDSIRYSNSTLANYITSAIKRAVRVDYPDVDAVGIPSTIFRNGLKSTERRSTFNNMDLMKMFDGVSENLSMVRIGKVKGKDLFDLILENTQNNLKSKTRNAIIQWSDIQVNRTLIREISEGKSNRPYTEAIKIRKGKHKQFAPIDFDKEYTVLMSDKYLLKDTDNITVPKRIKDNFEKIPQSYETLFKKYLKMIDYDVKITNKTKEERIL